MLIMESEAKIRRLYEVKGHDIKQIARDLNISKNTVKRVIRSGKAGKKYKRENQHRPKLGDFTETLLKCLVSDHKLRRKDRRSAMRYYTELSDLGYSGAYDSIQRFVKDWRQRNGECSSAFIPLSFEPGEAYQFDWSTEYVQIAGITCKVKVAHLKLSYSRKFFLKAYMRETQEMLFDAHDNAFSFFEGSTRRGIYDNMKTAVDSIFIGKKRNYNDGFLSIMDHYLIEPTACTPAAGWEKGQVEKQVFNIRDWVFLPKVKVKTLDELNHYLLEKCHSIAKERQHPEFKEKTIEECYQEERVHLVPLTATFDGYVEKSHKVSSTCLISFDRNKYSVDCAYANQVVSVRSYASKIIVVAKDDEIASHERLFGRDKTVLCPWHYLPLLERKPGALRNGAPFKNWELPAAIAKVKNTLMAKEGGDRESAEILLAMNEFGIEVVTVACELAISDSAINRDYIFNVMSRLTESEPPEEIETPDSLKLRDEPKANCSKYDALLQELTIC